MDISSLCLNCFNEKTGNGACPHCGYVHGGASEEHYYLLEGSMLQDRYIVGTVLGHGGFGITYIGYDTKLDKRVAIKEYLPTDISTRVPGQSTVTTFSGEKYDQFAYGLERFIGEAKTLARYGGSPGIVSISDYFNENNTAYIVMEYLDGITLAEYLKRSGGTISYEETASIIRPVMDALREVHAAGMIHRDISPDNIFITTNNQVKLLDFGAARHAMGEKSKSLSVVLKPGYAPPEQYYTRGKQGPWTDVYALAATIYRMLTGENPPEAMERMVGDTLRSLHLLTTRLPVKFADAVMRALSITSEDRFQTVEAFEDAMFGEGSEAVAEVPADDINNSAPTPLPITPEPEPAEEELSPPQVRKEAAATAAVKDTKKKKRLIGGIAAVAVIALILIISVTGKQPSSNTSLSSPAASPSTAEYNTSTDNGGSGGNEDNIDTDTFSHAGKDIETDLIKIAFIPISTAGKVSDLYVRAIEEALSPYSNIEMHTYDPMYDVNNQIDFIQECIALGYDAIIMVAMVTEALNSAILDAEEAGIPVITIDCGSSCTHTMHIQADDYEMGWQGAMNLTEACGNTGNVIILDAPSGQVDVARMGIGAQDYFEQNTNMNIIDHQHIDYWSTDNAQTTMSALLTKYSDIKAVYCASDDIALGAVQAIEAAHRQGEDIFVWGSAGYAFVFEMIEDGRLYGTSWYDSYSAVSLAIETVLDYIATGNNSVISGFSETPVVYIAPEAVTKDNVKTIYAKSHWEN